MEGDADAVDATVGGGEDLDAEAVLLEDLAGMGDVAGDLGDEAADGGRLVVFGQAERFGNVVGVGDIFRGLDVFRGTVLELRDLVGEELAEAGDFEVAGDDPGAIR